MGHLGGPGGSLLVLCGDFQSSHRNMILATTATQRRVEANVAKSMNGYQVS